MRTLVLASLLAACAARGAAKETIPPPLTDAQTHGDLDGDGRIIWWTGWLDYTCSSVHPDDAGAKMHVYRLDENHWNYLGGNAYVLRHIRPGEENKSYINLSREDAYHLLVATFYDGQGRVTDVETAVVAP